MRSSGIGKGLMGKRIVGSLAALLVVASGFHVSGCSHSSGGGGMAPVASTAPGSTTTTNAPQATTPVTTTPVAPVPPAPTYGTRKCWPIVFVHGLAGFKQLGFLE